MSAKVKILAPITNKESLIEALEKVYEVNNIRGNANKVWFCIGDIAGNHAFVLEGENWHLYYEDYTMAGDGILRGKKFLESFMPIYNKIQEERHAEELKALVNKKEAEIVAKAKKYNYRVIRKEEKGKIKLVLVRPGTA